LGCGAVCGGKGIVGGSGFVDRVVHLCIKLVGDQKGVVVDGNCSDYSRAIPVGLDGF